MSLSSTAAELRECARDLRGEPDPTRRAGDRFGRHDWDEDELAEHLDAMADEIEDAAEQLTGDDNGST